MSNPGEKVTAYFLGRWQWKTKLRICDIIVL